MPAIQFSEYSDVSDLITYLERARKLDPGGLVKFKSFGDVLAVYVSPIFSSNLLGDGPTVLGLRTLKLANAHQMDLNFELAAILERLVGVGESTEGSMDWDYAPSRGMVACWADTAAATHNVGKRWD